MFLLKKVPLQIQKILVEDCLPAIQERKDCLCRKGSSPEVSFCSKSVPRKISKIEEHMNIPIKLVKQMIRDANFGRIHFSP